MSAVIRPAAPEDADGIWAVLEPVFRAGETYCIERDVSREQALAYWLAAPRRVFVAETGGEAVGTFALVANQRGGGAHVANASYVTAAAARGQGVATAMLAHSLETARALGFSAMQFNAVVETNAAAVRLWQAHGFRVAGRIPGGFRHPREGPVDLLIMHRAL